MNPAGSPPLLAMYPDVPTLVEAARRLRGAGCEDFEVFVPFPSEEVDEIIPGKRSPLGWVMLGAGIAAAAGAYFLQWYASHDYPLNVGGRPLHSWPAFIPVTFELTVLTSALVGVGALLWICGLPRLDYPTFNSPHFKRASQDRMFIYLRHSPSSLASHELRALLGGSAEIVEELPS